MKKMMIAMTVLSALACLTGCGTEISTADPASTAAVSQTEETTAAAAPGEQTVSAARSASASAVTSESKQTDSRKITLDESKRLFGGYVSTRNSAALNLRSLPDIGSDVLIKIPDATQLSIYDCGTKGWYLTSYKGKTGYVSAEYIKKIEDDDGAFSGNAAKLDVRDLDGAWNFLNPDGSKETGIGDLLAVDVGGATTDIYSVCDGMPRAGMDTIFKGLPEPYIKRTVEGDIGMRYSIHGIEEAVGTGYISQLSGLPEERCREMIDYLGKNTEVVPTDAESEALDFALASGAIKTAVTRHAGRLEEFYTMNGIAYMQTGKDLREIRQIIVTGGSLIHTKRTGKIASAAFWDPQDPFSLKPKQADVWVDRSYILAAMGLLSGYHPGTALRIMKKELKKDGYQE